ncbi:unnamed protein product [Paramecium pentaurelia]|uniref:Major facilitator superfamily (MFS) profile domain-containing protein n=1 Tax=Paramecium pentaurelia TaxID=43138 RepID=A0A8S1TUL6_9CILI|nr:unnamed protein product [Paramecium pentaurelia]
MQFEVALEKCGNNGWYQIRLFLISSLLTFILSATIMSATYNYIVPQLYCNGQPCTEDQKTCSEKNYQIDPDFKYKNIVTEFNLFCENKKYIMIASTINFLGAVIGGSILSQVSDYWGRYKTLLLSLIFTNIGFIGIYLSATIVELIIFTFIFGFFQVGVYIMIPVLINEISGYDIKQIYSTGTLIFWCLGEILMAISFFAITNWRTIQLIVIVIPGFISLILTCISIQESPRYLYQIKDYDKALNVFRYIARVNGNEFDEQVLEHSQMNSVRTNYSIFDLFKLRQFASSSVGFILISYALHLIYYGGQFVLQDISIGNMIYKIGILLGISELIGYSMITYMIPKLQRKYNQIFFFSIQILGCLSFLFYGISQYKLECQSCFEEIVVILLCCLIRFFNSFGFGLLRQHTLEIYPTSIRGTGSGFLFTLGILGSFSSSYMIALANYFEFNQVAFLGICSISGIIGAILTKETYQKKLIDDVDESIRETYLDDGMLKSN